MADAPVIVTDAADNTPAVGQLFKDTNFFLSQRLPTRSKFVADVESNGGRVVKLEKNADFVIADHMRKPTPAGSFSYTLIEQAIRNGVFPNPADHALGPTVDSPRAVGSRMPGKRTRTAFTAEDDMVLWQWVEQEKAKGEFVKGNEPYKRLEAVNPRHTWQAWRDHYVRKLIDNPPFGATGADASPMDSEAELPQTTARMQPSSKRSRSNQLVDMDADQTDLDLLWEQARDIENMDETMYEEAWDLWAQVNDKHSADEWRRIWEADVRPVYRKQRAKAKTKRRHASMSGDDNDSPTDAKARKKGKGRAVPPIDGNVEFASPGDAEASTVEPQQAKGASPAADETMEQTAGGGRPLEDPDDDLAALETWQGANSRKSTPKQRVQESDAPTSDINRAVGDQIRTEMNGTTSGEHLHSNEQVLTSDINRAADSQMRKEANGPEPMDADAEMVEKHSSSLQATQHESAQPHSQSLNGAIGNDHTQGRKENDEPGAVTQDNLRAWYAERVQELNGITGSAESGIDSETSGGPVHSLTEANLVSQQAAHAEPLTRGVDLPVDDQNKDRSEYVKFLQDAIGQPQDREDANSDNDLPSAARPVKAAPNIPVSSQQEVDKTMKDALDWPSSPQHEDDQSESQQFETQVPRATLPLSKNRVRSLMPDFELSSQSLMSQPNLSQGEYDATAPRTRRDDRPAQPDIFEGLEDINDTHIDLSIPEPEGEFTFTSSPERNQPSAGRTKNETKMASKAAESQRSGGNPGASANQVVNISSDASSSSLPSSQPEAEGTLPRTEQHAVETQDILNAETQRPDFFMPLPDDEQEQEEEVELAPQASQRRAKNARDGGPAQMQVPDLSMPLPADWDPEVDAGRSTSGKLPARQPKQKQKQKQKVVDSQTMDVEKELESWLDMQQVRGFTEASAIAAMQCSSMRPDLAELVLLAERGGHGFPDDVPGIWSEREDGVLESGDSGALRRLEAKHGWDECDARMRFLAEWREA